MSGGHFRQQTAGRFTVLDHRADHRSALMQNLGQIDPIAIRVLVDPCQVLSTSGWFASKGNRRMKLDTSRQTENVARNSAVRP